ncbi:MAG: hypothetical protein BWY82_00603 [Verrucomicrobia bacterium ADurb.Bin474]|nr:MAG: hypothetical protein BWY82_00603 [Verrucomicrobia bacterium ADurb.Bin474]
MPGFEIGRKFKIDNAEPSGLHVVGDVAHKRIIMPHAVLFKLPEQADLGFLTHIVRPMPTIRCHDVEILRMVFQNARHKGATLTFEVFENANLILVALLRRRTAVVFMNSSVVSDLYD